MGSPGSLAPLFLRCRGRNNSAGNDAIAPRGLGRIERVLQHDVAGIVANGWKAGVETRAFAVDKLRLSIMGALVISPGLLR